VLSISRLTSGDLLHNKHICKKICVTLRIVKRCLDFKQAFGVNKSLFMAKQLEITQDKHYTLAQGWAIPGTRAELGTRELLSGT